ncbi:hypothetical protein ACFWJ4_41110 [Kitasatospora sp. NPDC127067]|uniref:hypothetical protein n=1 Tax=Kitasatospora sp. NPDC127067 TaxID=3347126 RepID=UPI0036587597
MRIPSFAGATALSAALFVLALPAPAHAATGVFSVQPLGNIVGGAAVEDPEPGACYDMAPGEFSMASNDTDAVAHTFPGAGCRGRVTDIVPEETGGLGVYGSVRFDS